MSNLNDPRVLFAAERTLLAWNRTSLGFIAFGFVIERAGILLKALSGETEQASYLMSTLMVGVSFIVLGSFCALFSSYQFSRVLSTLHAEEFPSGYIPKWGVAINIIVALLGLALVTILAIKHILSA